MADAQIKDNAVFNDLQHGKDVLRKEARALDALCEALGDSFVEAVDAIATMKGLKGSPGRLIVAGIGKSGHVARKIAATMASTGTPAYFVHPGEASHGDLGMITENDVVLMLSNSGENQELNDLMHYTRRYGITLIAMTSKADSTLAKHADIQLVYPRLEEACPNGLAPTTSTTMMIAFGDALAVALLKRSGLTADQFKKFHPGGKLGQQLQTVSDLMHDYDSLPLVQDSAVMSDALLVMTEKNLGGIIVVTDDASLCGIITDGDLKRHMSDDLLTKPVTEIMNTSPKSIANDALAVEALQKMTKTHGSYITSLLVMDGDSLVGMIRLQDCLQAGVV